MTGRRATLFLMLTLSLILAGCRSTLPQEAAPVVEAVEEPMSPQEILEATLPDPADLLAPHHEQEQAFGDWIGQPFPDFAIQDLEGVVHRLSDYRGEPVILNIWATWCGPCKLEMPHLSELYEERREEGLVILGLSNEEEEPIARFDEVHQIPYPLLLSRTSQTALEGPFQQIGSVPTTFLIGTDGTLRSVKVGYHEKRQLEEFLEAMKAVEQGGGPA